MNEQMKLAAKIAAARVKLGSLQPDKINADQKYKYISADKVLERGGDVLAAAGVVVIPSVIEATITNVERQGKAPRIDATLKMMMTISDGESEYIASWFGVGSDYATPDKAVYKAMTSGHKYFLMKLLNIGVGNEDSEHDNTPEPQPQPQKSAPRKPAPQPQPDQPISDDYISAEEGEYLAACEVTASDGERYGDRPTEKLTWVINNPKSPADKKHAAQIILAWRNSHK